VASGNPANIPLSTAGTYTISVYANIPDVALPCFPSDPQSFTVIYCCPQLIGPLNASVMPGDPCIYIFSAQVSNPENAPVTYEWSFQDGSTDTTSVPHVEHTYPPGTITTGITSLTLKSPGCDDQTLTTIITLTSNCVPDPDPCPPGTHRDAAGNCVPDEEPCPPGTHRDAAGNCVPDEEPCPPGTHRDEAGNCVPDGGGMSCLCSLLLLLGLLAGVLAVILGSIAACTFNPVLGIVAAVLALVGVILIVLWVLLCAKLACRIFDWLRTFVVYMVLVISPVVGLIVSIIGPGVICGVSTSLIISGYWGTILAILDFLGPKFGCPLQDVPWPWDLFS
jgi:hypothetical protein